MTALKTTSLRLRGTDVKVLEEEGVDSDGAVTSKSKLQSKVKALSGVDILTETGDYKSTYEILSQIADVWEDISNMDQAALLEMLAGKRNASVLAAILQAPEELKAAYEDAANAEGSALSENEKYLDSIQGRIDQFNNSVQSLWSHILDDDMVKGIVTWATKIIKSLDTTEGKLLALVKAVALLMAYKKVNPFEWAPKIGAFFAQFSGQGFKGGLSIIGQYFKQLIGIAPVMKTMTAETVANTLATITNDNAKTKEIMTTMGLTSSTQMLTQAEREAAISKLIASQSTNKLTNEQIMQMAAQWGVKVAYDATTGSLKVLDGATKSFMASNPVGWILLIVSAIMALVMWLANTESRVEKLRSKLSDLKSELSDVQSEIDSVNSELETTQDRMAELLAMDSLSFTEQEELERLEKENDALQRKLDLLELQNKQKGKKAAKTFVETMQEDQEVGDDKRYSDGSKVTFWSEVGWNSSADAGVQHPGYLSETDTIDLKIQEYKDYAEELADVERQIIAAGGEETDTGKLLKKDKDRIEAKMSEIDTYVNDKTDQWIKDSEGVEYFTGDNLEDWQIESNKWIDAINDTRDKWAIASGGNNAMSNAIKNVLGREEFADESDQIDKYVEDLKAGDAGAKAAIEGIIKSNTDLKNALEAKGLNPEDAISYFTNLSSTSAFDTLKGKIAEVSEAAVNFEKLLKGDSFEVDGVDTGLVGLFDEEGKIIQTKLSQVFNNTSDQTRAEITKLLEGSYDMIADGLDDSEINYLMNRMGLSFSRAILEIEETNLANKNLELFPGLEDEISGIINTFNELTSAVGSVVDALDTLDQARAEEAYSGSMSLETLEALMKSTDDYADLIEVDETGAIKLATNAQEILVNQKLDAIKKNAELALKEAELTYQEALHNEQTYTQTGPAQKFMRGLWNEVGGAMSFVSSLWGDLTSGNWSGAWDRAKAAQEATITKKETDYANKASAASAAVADAAKKVENAEKMNKIAQGLTPDNVRARYSSDEASGGNKTKEDVEEDRFKRAMDYWENRIAANQARYEQLQSEIDLLEKQGKKAAPEYYEEQIKLEEERLWLLEQQKKEAKKHLKNFKEGSEEWWEVAGQLNDIEGEIDDVTASIQDLNDAIAEVNWYKFEEPLTRFDNHTDTLETIRTLVAPNGEEDWFDDEGNWTEEGVTVAGTYIQEIEMDKESLNKVNDLLNDKLSLPYEGNEEYYKSLELGIDSEQDLYDKREKLQKQGQGYAKDIQDNQQNIVDMYESQIDAVEEYIDTLIEGYNDYIDSVKEALDAERDLYEFKKNIQKQSKDIAELERRIASLSGSTNKSDIAERRKLEAELYDARESLNDTYYDHSQDALNNALDDEQSAYEETMNKFIENLRTSLEAATQDMDTFLGNVTTLVSLNAGVILQKYQETELPLDDALTSPWEDAKEAVGNYSGDALDLMNQWALNGFFTTTPEKIKGSLTSPWTAGQTAVDAFKKSVDTQMKNVVSAIETNVKTASSKLSKLYKQIEDTEKRAASVGTGSYDGGTGGYGDYEYDYSDDYSTDPPETPDASKKPKELTEAQKIAAKIVRFGSAQGRGMNAGKSGDNGIITWNNKEYKVQNSGKVYRKGANLYTAAVEHLKFGDRQIFGYNGKIYGYLDGAIQEIEGRFWSKKGYNDFVAGVKANYSAYAKGTTGTTRDEWAITDEPQFGDELVLVPGKDGNLSFMRKGTGVVPADMTQKLFELAQIPTSDLMNKNLTAIVPNITKNDFKNEFNFESLVHVDTVDSDTLPKLEKMVDKKIDDFSKSLNYSLKKFTR